MIEGFYTILIAFLAAVNCGLIGTYLMLRKMAMMGETMAHAILPGMVISLLLTGSKVSPILLLGAASSGMLVTFLVAFLNKKAKLDSDTAIGINSTCFFALGIIFISFFSKKIDLDPECSLYGDITYASLDVLRTATGLSLGPRSLYVLGIMLMINLCFIICYYKQLFITTFDIEFATAIGVRTVLWHYLLMGLASFTTITAFEIAGAILVVALLVVTPATAYLITDRLPKMLIITTILCMIISISGYYLTVCINGSMTSAMVTVSGCLFLVIFLFKKITKKNYNL